ncbi:MAG: hypothetical protein AAF825_11620 [Pseudomonadota bacterium]
MQRVEDKSVALSMGPKSRLTRDASRRHTVELSPWPIALFRTLLRIATIVLIALGVHFALDEVMHLTDALPAAERGALRALIILGILAIYAALIAVPFVPGIEIGLSLLMLRGPEMAPAVYVATLCGLSLAYGMGRLLPLTLLRQTFSDLHLRSACRLIDRIAPLGPKERLVVVRGALPRWLGDALVRYRYLSLAALLNVPGNALLGGGGGISLVAGVSGVFSTWATLLTLALAVAPVPLAVWIWDISIL